METKSITGGISITPEERRIKLQKDLEANGDRIIRVAKDGWPVELIIGRPIVNFLRKLILTDYKISYREWRNKGGCTISFK